MSEAGSESTGETLADAQEITFVLNNEPDGIAPGITNNSFATPFLVNCFEGLVTYDENGAMIQIIDDERCFFTRLLHMLE